MNLDEQLWRTSDRTRHQAVMRLIQVKRSHADGHAPGKAEGDRFMAPARDDAAHVSSSRSLGVEAPVQRMFEPEDGDDENVPGATSYHIVLGGLWGGAFDAAIKQSFVDALRATFQPVTLDVTGYTKAHWNPPHLTGSN